jgi:hypothetical protein
MKRQFRSLLKKKTSPETTLANLKSRLDSDNPVDRAAEKALLTGRQIDLSEVYTEIPKVYGYTPPVPVEQDVTFTMDLPLDVAARSYGILGTGYQREFILMSLHRLLLRGFNNRLLARIYNVSEPMITQWKNLLKERFREEAENTEFSPFVGETLLFYRELITEAIKLSTSSSASKKEKLAAMSVALEAKKDTTKFLQMVGFFDNNRFTGHREVDSSMENVEVMRELSRDLIDSYKNHKVYKDDRVVKKAKELVGD